MSELNLYPMKEIKIIVEGNQAHFITAVLDKIKASGYTVFNNLSGKGHHGYIKEHLLYNNILSLSRNKLFYTEFNIDDTFQNRIYLIFLHISFLFIKVKSTKDKEKYDVFYQKMFDLIFRKIETNMREIGYGDTTINKNMKFLVRVFYNILLNCEKFSEKTCS